MKAFFQRLHCRLPVAALCIFPLLLLSRPAHAQAHHTLAGHLVSAAARMQPVDSLPATNQLHLFLGLPLRNQDQLDALLQDLHDPASTNYHQWLTPAQFTERFGPTDEDYQKVIRFSAQHGFKITATDPGRLMLNVDSPVSNIEQTFNLKLRRYRHPRENRTFYAPDAEPLIDSGVPLMHIAGLDNYSLPRHLGGSLNPTPMTDTNIVAYATGSSPGGFFMGNDFRKAYVPGVTNTGAGQYIAIIDVGGPYYSNDVYMYEVAAGLSTNTYITNILLSGSTGIPVGSTANEGEQVLDIDMAMSMAPGAKILNYEGEAHDVFKQIGLDNLAKQMTLSYGFGIDSIIQQYFQQFVAQGQAMSQASGDGGADLDGGTGLTGAPYSTIVGGTSLTTGAAGIWQSDDTWGGSGGGISGYGIPTWQQGISMVFNQGSTSFRNYPDVAMPAVNIFTIYMNGTAIGATGGTSAASPLWAGFMALVNQQAAVAGKPPVGFANPPIYAIGKGVRATYTSCFHDIITGNTFNSQNPTRFGALSGYDLCTGWGSPTGINTINALAGVGTNDFTFYPTPATVTLVAGATATVPIVMTRLNGLGGSAVFSITNLPVGLTAAITPVSTTNATSLTLTSLTNTLPGTYSLTLAGAIGTLTHTVTMSLIVKAPIPGALPVTLAGFYNRAGIYNDGVTFNGGVDGSSSAFSANLTGGTLSYNGLVFKVGPPNTLDVISCAGQIIPVSAGNFNTLQLLATGVQGSQVAKIFTVTYTDNSTATFAQSFSDWANPQNYPGETSVLKMPYRDLGSGGSQTINVSIFGYNFTLDPTRTVKSITLPVDSNLILVSAVLATDPISVPLATYYNRAGIYADGVTFTNPATGGIDGGGFAYSANLLGGSQTWSNIVFNFGPANATNVISSTNQTILLPAGNDSSVLLLGTSVGGNQSFQSFIVTYTDNSTTSFTQSFSDWFSPQSNTGESKAVTMGHRNSSNGTADNRTFYLYGYSFALNSAKTIKSIKLPNNPNVIITAISLIPNWQPTFKANPFSTAIADATRPYSGSLATNLTDLNGGTLSSAKVSGPAWLNIAANGTLSGTPANSDANTNTFIISVTDTGGLTNTATLNIYVNGAPSFLSDPFSAASATTGQNYSGSIASAASDPNPGDALTFAKVSGPAWLTVGSDGTLSGQPATTDAGANSFAVSVSDPRGLTGSATLNLNVLPGSQFVAALTVASTNLQLTWSGGTPPYQVQVSTDLTTTNWVNVGGPLSTNTLSVPLTNAAAFYRILGQ